VAVASKKRKSVYIGLFNTFIADPHTPLYLINSITHIRVAKKKKKRKGRRAIHSHRTNGRLSFVYMTCVITSNDVEPTVGCDLNLCSDYMVQRIAGYNALRHGRLLLL
jgi:hypothetical protein